MIKTAIIGVSGYGAAIYNLCKAMVDAGEMSIDAAVIRTPSKVPDTVTELEGMGCRIFPDADALFTEMKGKLDLVCIPTGIETHKPFTVAALEAGAHVMVEKPAAGTVEEVDAMIEASERTGLSVSVGFQDIYRTDLHRAKKRLLAGEWGKVETVTIHGRWPRARSYYARNNWAGKLKCGESFVYDSPANNALAHYMNVGLFLAGNEFGESARIKSIEADLFRAYPIESFDTITTRAVAENGVRFHYTVTHATMDAQDPIITVITDQGRVIFKRDRSWVEDKRGTTLEELDHVGSVGGRDNILPSIIAKLKGEDAFTCGLNIARAHTAFISQLHAEHEIRNFPADLIEERMIQVNDRTDEHLHVTGLAEAMMKATEECALLSELGAPWA
ncbi:MAG: Gfo/Idh/MocA family protein [Planctomycetota bacterium]|jgi:predicted dehydrogenase